VSVLADSGYKEGEWFCSAFEGNGKANKSAIFEFASIRQNLSGDVLYGAYGENRQLKEIPFAQLLPAT
jgi:hypothetical protein